MSSHEEMDAISNAAKNLYWRMSRIDPPGSDASPESKNLFNSLLTTIAQAAGQTLDTVVGLSYLVADDEGNPPNLSLMAHEWYDLGQEPESDEESDQLCKEKTNQGNELLQTNVEDEVERIFEKIGEGSHRYTIEQYFEMVLQGGYSGKVVEKEREAYRRMLISYKCYSLFEIATCFKRYNVAHSSVSRTTADVSEIGAIMDPFTRLQRREALIFKSPSEDIIASYLLMVIRNIEGLKAYDDWLSISTQSQHEFIASFARSIIPDDFDFVDGLDIPQKEKKKQYTALITPIRTKHSKLVEQRKRFQDLYFRFGPIVLLDPMFMYISPKNYPRASRWFLPVFKEVIKRVDGPDPGQTRYNDDQRFVTRVLQVLGGGNISNYVKDFIMENCYWLCDEESDSEEEKK
ncbi:hypothetical protein BDP27DRAFT_1428000 [Rhodocollybia butyracea]|uniref:Uncharacterized protein n=1 Tax=Rhodocollybia butyracea TaxID=206335 RepID=A0A9P5U096_9AGAR|nr:hypothetical protein BDP27DRAFT_1428000 [Rhodocollybia butyracea]